MPMVTLITQLVYSLGVQVDHEAANLLGHKRYWQYPSDTRDLVERALPPGADGKAVLPQVCNGGTVPDVEDAEVAALLLLLSQESLLLRWLAATLLPDAVAQALKDRREWPENTAYHMLWTLVEDACLSAWEAFALEHGPSHLSLHFDGLMASTGNSHWGETCARDSEAFIERSTGFKVCIAERNTTPS